MDPKGPEFLKEKKLEKFMEVLQKKLAKRLVKIQQLAIDDDKMEEIKGNKDKI
jgi:hypothetical protein